MNTPVVGENQIQAQIDQLKMQFPQTRDLYREVCVLLFFRYSITPTANKLYQYVRKGSMSAPAEALNKFWLELRDKSRVRIEHPDLPDVLKEATGNFVGDLWLQAQAAAQANFSIQMDEMNEKIAQAQDEARLEREIREKNEEELKSTRTKLENAHQQLTESEKNHAVDISTLRGLEKTLKTLQGDKSQLERSIEVARQGLSTDLDKMNVALIKAEDRYKALEARALLEMDGERQRAIKLEKELSNLGDTLRAQQKLHLKEMAASQKINSNLREKIGTLLGQLAQLKLQQREMAKRHSTTERALANCTMKLFRLQAKEK